MRVAAYLRVSTEEQARKGISIQAQYESIELYCRSKQWKLVKIYTDDGYSAKNLQRPGMQQLLHDVRHDRFDVAVAWKLDRFTRKLFDLLYLVEYFTKNNISLGAVQDSIDTTSKEGMLLLHILGALAEWERETIIERAREAAAHIARHGHWHGGPPPFGYTYIPKTADQPGRLEPVPEQAAIVQIIYDLCTREHYGASRIADFLNGNNPKGMAYPTPKGARAWSSSLVSRILHNPVYAGWIVRHINRKLKTKEVYEGKHEPIIRREQWSKAQAIIKTRREGQRQKQSYLLSGLLRCGVCGAKMRAKQQWSNWPREPRKYIHSYVCYTRAHPTHHLAKEFCNAPYHSGKKLEDTVLDEIVRCMRRPEVIQQAMEKAREAAAQSRSESDRARIREELADINQRLEKWAELMEEGSIDIMTFQDRISALQERRRQIESQLADEEVAASSDSSASQRPAVLQIMAQSPVLKGKYTPEQLWTLLRMLVKEIIVAADGSVESITWRMI